jgi:hypothetical protein
MPAIVPALLFLGVVFGFAVEIFDCKFSTMLVEFFGMVRM